MSWVLLVILTYPEHNDSGMDGVAAAPRPACPLQERKESPHEDLPPSVALTSTHARRHADSQLLAPYHRWLSTLRGPVCQALPHLGLRERLHPDGVCFTLFLRDHPGPPVDGGVHPVP